MFNLTFFKITTTILFIALLFVASANLLKPGNVDYGYFVRHKKETSQLTDIERRVYRTCAYMYNDTPKGKTTLEMATFDMLACEAVAARFDVRLRSNLTTTMYRPAIEFFKNELENESDPLEG